MNRDLLRAISLEAGASGSEGRVRERIIAQLPEKAAWQVDALGNLIVTVPGKKRPKNKVMLEAHMDEVGFIVTYIGENGLLRFAPVGGVSASVICGKRAVFANGVVGVFGVTPVHQLRGDAKRAYPEIGDMYLDIGAASKAEAAEKVSVGDTAVFLSDYEEFGEYKIKGKALDDRAGCVMLLELMRRELPFDAVFVFTVQEEVGTRGAGAAAFTVAPDYAIVLETTTAADISGTEPERQVCVLGEGPAVSFMDRATVYDPKIYALAMRVAAEKKIRVQPKSYVAGGNDSGAVHKSRGGVKTVSVSLPCRYLHSPSCVLDLRDADAGEELALALLEVFGDA